MSASNHPTLRSIALSSVGRKFLLGLTGLALCGFLVLHLAGNFLILVGRTAFDSYGDGLRNLPIAVPGELALAGLFVAHLVLAVWVTRENKAARPVAYAVHERKGGRTVASKTMIITGVVTAVFLVLHLIQFRFGIEELKTAPGGPKAFGFSEAVLYVWRNSPAAPFNVATYLAAFALLGIHVRHGLQSALRSVGVSHPDWQPVVDKVSIAYGVVIWLGYSLIPVWVLARGMAS